MSFLMEIVRLKKKICVYFELANVINVNCTIRANDNVFSFCIPAMIHAKIILIITVTKDVFRVASIL